MTLSRYICSGIVSVDGGCTADGSIFMEEIIALHDVSMDQELRRLLERLINCQS